VDSVDRIEAARHISNELVGVRGLPSDSIRRYLGNFGVDEKYNPEISRRQYIRNALKDASASTLLGILGDLGIDAQRANPTRSQKFGILLAESQLEEDFADFCGDSAGLALVFFDVDNFKALNTTYTESVVDTDVLEPLMRFIEAAVVGRGRAYSVGGDEFIVLLRNSTTAEAVAFAERLRSAASELAFLARGEKVSLTLSLGVAAYPGDGDTLTAVRRRANEAENRAKTRGRNCVEAASQAGV